MDLVRSAILSPWGFAGMASVVALAAAAVLLRGRRRVGAALTAAVLALTFGSLAVDVAAPKAAAAHLRRAAEGDLMQARQLLSAGFNREARAALDRAEAQFRRAGGREDLARVQLLEGDLERLQGRLREARAHYAAAVQQMTTAGQAEAPDALLRLGQIDATIGDAVAARKALVQAIALYQRQQNADGEARTKLADGILARQSAALAEASNLLGEAAALFAARGDRGSEARALLELAQLSQMLVQATEADARADAASRLFVGADMPLGVALAHLVKADNLVDKERAEAAENELNAAVAILESLPQPVAAAAKFLGLPAVETLRVRSDSALAENLAAFPDYQWEARRLLDDIFTRIDRSRWDASRAH